MQLIPHCRNAKQTWRIPAQTGLASRPPAAHDGRVMSKRGESNLGDEEQDELQQKRLPGRVQVPSKQLPRARHTKNKRSPKFRGIYPFSDRESNQNPAVQGRWRNLFTGEAGPPLQKLAPTLKKRGEGDTIASPGVQLDKVQKAKKILTAQSLETSKCEKVH